MEIQTNVHTVFLMVGPTECGKTTFAKEVLIPSLQFIDETKRMKANVQYLSSDAIRQELLGHEHDKYDQVMLETSEQAFHLLFEKLRMVTSFPVNAEFVVVDTTGLAEDFRAKVREIARENNYRVEVILFDYRNREDYYASERSKKLITSHINRLKKEVIRSLAGERYARIHRIRSKDFYSPATLQVNPAYSIVISDKDEYVSTILPPDQTYLIIGDIHECVEELKGLLVRQGFVLNENKLLASGKEKQTKIILAGDWIDKGKQTKETIEFLYENRELFYFVTGNHENFVYKYLHGEISEVDEELLRTYFDSIQILSTDDSLREKFTYLYRLSRPFYKRTGITGPSFYVTHAPCKNKYIGKLDSNSVRHQRNFRIIRTEPYEDQLAFLKTEAVKNHPYHLFGHIAAKQSFRIKNKIHLDTGCVHGNALTSVTISHKLFTQTYPSAHGVIQEDLPILFQNDDKIRSVQEMNDEQKRILLSYVQNQINFISGTMPPADKDEATNQLESLEKALQYFRDQGVQHVVLQPKYMGSRCNVYLFQDVSKCFAVSRHGHPIKQIDLSNIYQNLLQRFHGFMEQHQVQMMILDGELMPWKALGEGLVEKQFKPIQKALESELAFLKQNDFDQAYQKLLQVYQESGFEKDQYHHSKHALIEKYGGNTYQNFKNLCQFSETYVPVEEHVQASQVYQKQLEIYAADRELEFKPFGLLKLVNESGEEQIPNWKTSDMYRFVTDDEYRCVDLYAPDWYDQAHRYYSFLTMEKQMEGVVVKPEFIDDKTVPYMKVRNPEYLSIIYGYDYRFPHKYRKLMKQKKIGQKLRTSMKEYQLGRQMLAIPFSGITEDNAQYQSVVSQLLWEVSKEKEIDPRL